MRLTCPNCGAQYEVPDAVIPASGRDVQCSNCGNTWFQHYPDNTPPDADLAAPEAAYQPEPEPEARPDPAPATQRRLDPDVAEILREEAKRERAARAVEAGMRLETQPDLGLDAPRPLDASHPDERRQQVRTRLERLRGGAAHAKAPSAPARDSTPEDIDPPSRRNLFPDIDEINSSLSATDDFDAAQPLLPEEALPPPRKSGFRAGFRLAVITCVLALIVYLMAPQIAALSPGLEAPLGQYVATVDALRGLLSHAVAGLLGLG
ncbi:MAG: zinc-ribbon domain-containing protein [Roseovarius sp.]|nr:zinc-ribbon domain-containing protein [Roseovarius sp.]